MVVIQVEDRHVKTSMKPALAEREENAFIITLPVCNLY